MKPYEANEEMKIPADKFIFKTLEYFIVINIKLFIVK